MQDVELILGLLAAVIALAIVAERIGVPYPILLVIGGLALGFIPGLPRIALRPDLVFLLFLPPLLYYAAWFTSWRDFRANRRPIALLAVGLVLATTVIVAAVARVAVPDLPWSSAFVLAAIVSPTDAIAATSIAQRLGVPRRVVTVLEGESLVNDATGLVAYRFAVAAVVTGAFSLAQAGVQFVVASVGGIAVGLVIGWLGRYIWRFSADTFINILISFAPPFAAYFLAESLRFSGVLAVVTAGLMIARRAPTLFTSDARLQATSVWQTVVFLLNGLAFILIGLQLPRILDALSGRTFGSLIASGITVSLAVVLVRVVWVFPATYLPRLLFPRLRANDPSPSWRPVVVIAWCGMRGVVSLAAALALPTETDAGIAFPARDLILFLTFCVIFATLVVQGLSLPPLIRALGLHDDGAMDGEMAQAQRRAAEAALARIEELAAEEWTSDAKIARVRNEYLHRIETYAALRDGDGARRAEVADLTANYLRLRRALLDAERRAVIALRDDGTISDEVLHRIERDLDLEETRIGA